MPSYLNPLIVTSIAALIAACVATVAFSDHLPRAARQRGVLAIGTAFALWLPITIWVAGTTLLDALGMNPIPLRPLAIFGPPLLLLGALTVSPRLESFARGISQRWLVGIQTLRIMGGVFLLLWIGGAIPWEFALPAGLGDVAVGAMAMVTLRRLNAGASDALLWVRRTNIAGVADFTLAVGTGVLTAPGPLQMLAFDRPNELILTYPLTLIPIFAVPVFIGAHILSIRIQNAAGGHAGRGARAAA